MATEPEEILELNLVQQLTTLGYTAVTIPDEAALLANLRQQLEKHNRTTLSPTEFQRILHQLNKGSIFDRAKTLRQKLEYEKDNGDAGFIELINQEHWCQNQFQVTRQVTVAGRYKNRYDVTLLINGLPLVQIELKKRGLELKEAFNQIGRYQRHSYWSDTVFGLFRYVQLFVISNGVNTKYFANNSKAPFKQTNFWTDTNNKRISRIEPFADAFLEKCHLSKMICKYTVLNEVDGILMILRPYQFYAVEAIIERVRNSNKNGYIWHTTGSGKTLTSFKASQILMRLPQVHKVVFVVDRRDLDGQTIREFNHFQKGSVDSSENTNILVQQFTDSYVDPGTKQARSSDLIVTTIQKLNNAIKNQRYLKRMQPLRDKNIVFIFDECHRSQFGETHERIKQFFTHHQMFGFTGTPIFADNANRNQLGKRTTKDLFAECLHKYVITDAIRDQNVLRFAVEYYKTFKQKSYLEQPDRKVAAIDTKEVFESHQHVDEVVDFIIREHDRKTDQRHFSAIFCVSNISMLIKYYDTLKARREAGQHNLRVATIFSYGTNEEDDYADGSIPDPDFDFAKNTDPKNQHTRDKMEEYIADYNQQFGTKFNTRDSKSFYNYYRDIGTKIKDREKPHLAKPADRIDILLVVNMFLTGFDAKRVNTMYVDKNLRQHGLIQAFSRTNRVIGSKKSHGFIVCFRNLKKATDDAVTLFSNKEAVEEILMKPYAEYAQQFTAALAELRDIAPEVDTVDDFYSEADELEFVKAFRKLVRLNNLMSGFTEYDLEELGITEQEFAEYRSKYADLYQKVKNDRKQEKESILQDIDFEIELIQRDEINVAYIMQLIAELHTTDRKKREQKRKEIMDLLGGEIQLRSKKELIEKFINQQLPKVKDVHAIPAAFEEFWNVERLAAFKTLYQEEDLKPEGLQQVLQDFIYTGRNPLTTTIREMLNKPLPLFKFSAAVKRITEKINAFVETFEEGIGGESIDEEEGREARRYLLYSGEVRKAAEQDENEH